MKNEAGNSPLNNFDENLSETSLMSESICNSDCYSLRVRPSVRTEKRETNLRDFIKFNGSQKKWYKIAQNLPDIGQFLR